MCWINSPWFLIAPTMESIDWEKSTIQFVKVQRKKPQCTTLFWLDELSSPFFCLLFTEYIYMCVCVCDVFFAIVLSLSIGRSKFFVWRYVCECVCAFWNCRSSWEITVKKRRPFLVDFKIFFILITPTRTLIYIYTFTYIYILHALKQAINRTSLCSQIFMLWKVNFLLVRIWISLKWVFPFVHHMHTPHYKCKQNELQSTLFFF